MSILYLKLFTPGTLKSVGPPSEVKMSSLICSKFCFASIRVTNLTITKVYSIPSLCGYSGGVMLRTVVMLLTARIESKISEISIGTPYVNLFGNLT